MIQSIHQNGYRMMNRIHYLLPLHSFISYLIPLYLSPFYIQCICMCVKRVMILCGYLRREWKEKKTEHLLWWMYYSSFLLSNPWEHMCPKKYLRLRVVRMHKSNVIFFRKTKKQKLSLKILYHAHRRLSHQIFCLLIEI